METAANQPAAVTQLPRRLTGRVASIRPFGARNRIVDDRNKGVLPQPYRDRVDLHIGNRTAASCLPAAHAGGSEGHT